MAHLSTCLLSQRKLDANLTAALVERIKASPTVKYDPSFRYALPKDTMEAYVAGDPYLAAAAELCGTMNVAANIHTGGKSGENGLYKPLQIAVLVAHSGEGEPVWAMGGSEDLAYDMSDLPLPKALKKLYGSKADLNKLIAEHGWTSLTKYTRILTHLKVDTSSLPRGTDGKLPMPTIAEKHREWALKLFPEASIAKEGRNAPAKATNKTKAANAEQTEEQLAVGVLQNAAAPREVIAALTRLGNICYGKDAASLARKQAAADAGTLVAIEAAMRAHAADALVQRSGCVTLGNICSGTDAVSLARKQAAVDAGTLVAIEVAMRAHAAHAEVQFVGCATLGNICSGTDTASLARKQAAADAGTLVAIEAAMRAHAADALVQRSGCVTLGNICSGTDAVSLARKQAAVDAGTLVAIEVAMRAHAAHAEVQFFGCAALGRICYGSLARKKAAADVGAVEVVTAAADVPGVEAQAQLALSSMGVGQIPS